MARVAAVGVAAGTGGGLYRERRAGRRAARGDRVQPGQHLRRPARGPSVDTGDPARRLRGGAPGAARARRHAIAPPLRLRLAARGGPLATARNRRRRRVGCAHRDARRTGGTAAHGRRSATTAGGGAASRRGGAAAPAGGGGGTVGTAADPSGRGFANPARDHRLRRSAVRRRAPALPPRSTLGEAIRPRRALPGARAPARVPG